METKIFTPRTRKKCKVYADNKKEWGHWFRCVLEKSTEEDMIQTHLWCFKCKYGEIMAQTNIFSQDKGVQG